MLEFLYARVGHFGTSKIQLLESGQPLEMFQSGIGHLGSR